MAHDRSRILRLRMSESRVTNWPGVEQSVESASIPRGTLRFLGKVIDGGAMPGATDHVFLVNPVKLYGAETEGSPAVLAVDGSRTIPVVAIGASAPAVGDLLLAFSVGGRWVARAGGSTTLSCSPCLLPKKNLTLSWTNALLGAGSATLTFNPPSQWNSSCIHDMLVQLSCPGTLMQLSIAYFLSGQCPTGQPQSCTSRGFNPFSITLGTSSCSPLLVQFLVSGTGCPALWNDGYSAFTITE